MTEGAGERYWRDDCDGWIDIGASHGIHWTSWMPDRELNPQYAGFPDIERYGLLIDHPSATVVGAACCGGVLFDTPELRALREAFPPCHGAAVWQVDSWDPLTLSPSILCSCGDHGYIREGRWVAA